MPDLGPYAVHVLGSYALALGLLAAVVAVSVVSARRARRELERLEARHGRRRGGG